MGGGLVDHLRQPVRRSRQSYVDREVHQAFTEILVAVVMKVGSASGARSTESPLRHLMPTVLRCGKGRLADHWGFSSGLGVYGVGETLRHGRVAGPVHVEVTGVQGGATDPAGSAENPAGSPSTSHAAESPRTTARQRFGGTRDRSPGHPAAASS